MKASLEGIDWQSFLARPSLPGASAHTLERVADERVLITGAGGSIGSALALRVADLAPRKLVLLESCENHLFALQNCLSCNARVSADLVLGSVLDRNLLDEIFEQHRPTLIFHTAAYKHVPLLEEQPFAAMDNNVFGTERLATAACASSGRMIFLSTDKAVEPISVMGATKRVAEKLVLNLGGSAVRLGNVLATSASVAEVFAAQIAQGGPVTVTDPAARRYFLTLHEAVNLLLSAGTAPGEIHLFVPDLRNQHFIADLAHFMVRVLAPDRDLAVAFTTPRCGDKESEKLWGAKERAEFSGVPGLLSIESPCGDGEEFRRGMESLRAATAARDLPAALAALRSMVPEYTPSAAVAAVAERTSSRAAL